MRVPLADGTVVKAPEDLRDVALVLMADIFPTGYFAAANGFKSLSEAQVADATVVVLGCGPVGKPTAARSPGELSDLKLDTRALHDRRSVAVHTKPSLRRRLGSFTTGHGAVARRRATELRDGRRRSAIARPRSHRRSRRRCRARGCRIEPGAQPCVRSLTTLRRHQ